MTLPSWSKKAAIIAAAVIVALWFAVAVFEWTLCAWYGYETARDTRYSIFLGCMVKVNDKYVPRTELRVVQ